VNESLRYRAPVSRLRALLCSFSSNVDLVKACVVDGKFSIYKGLISVFISIWGLEANFEPLESLDSFESLDSDLYSKDSRS
jgi:hypothetical protein